MVRTPPKRNASRTPENGRPHKRLATSSPEEGEVDDDETPLPHASTLPPKPVSVLPASSPSPQKFPTKVKFPFKKKNGVDSSLPSKPKAETRKRLNLDGGREKEKEKAAVIYERSEEDERRIRENEQQHRKRPAHSDSSRWKAHNHSNRSHASSSAAVDHWEPSQNYQSSGRDRDRGRGNGASWQTYHGYDDDYHQSRRGWNHPPRGRSSPSPSRSSHSSTSTRRDKHRLPSYRDRSPTFNYTPPQRDYGVDRIRDQQRERDDLWNRDNWGRGLPDDEDRHHSSRDKDRGREDRYRGHGRDNDGRYWRAEEDQHYRPYDYDHDRDDRDHRRPRREDEDYRPVSPGADASSVLNTSPYRPLSPNGPRTPPPPSDPPPPSPPAPSDPRDGIPANTHTSISIPLPRKPAAPSDIHSPTPLPLPPASESAVQRDQQLRQRESGDVNGASKELKKRPVVRRSRKEEYEAYGRSFEGCGLQSDYDVTTKLGEGTFGEVHKAIHKTTRRVVALKRILMHNEKEGMPVTALREIKILKALKHPCIVDILDMFVVRSSGKDSSLSVYMVFPYMDHDLAGLLENERVKLQPSHIKLYMKQLLEGTEYMHRNHILHRDMKAANLLISNDGSLRIADFGLARAFDPVGGRGHKPLKERKYTNCVVTRWYRPPELLLGARQYGGEVDIWGIGCVLGEMFMRKPILPGTTDVDQLEKIWALCGTPNQHTWPNYDDLPGCEGQRRFSTTYSRRLRQAYDSIGVETCDLLDKMLTCNPKDRITATDALDHDYFWTDPLPADPKSLPSYEASHEFDKRSRRAPPQAGPFIQQNGKYQPPQGQPPFMGRPPPPRESFRNGPRGGQGPYPPHAPPYPPGPPPYGYQPNGPGPPFPPISQPFHPGDQRHRPPIPLGRGGHHNRRGGGGRPRGGGGGEPLPYS